MPAVDVGEDATLARSRRQRQRQPNRPPTISCSALVWKMWPCLLSCSIRSCVTSRPATSIRDIACDKAKPSYTGTACVTPSPLSSTTPVVRPEAYLASRIISRAIVCDLENDTGVRLRHGQERRRATHILHKKGISITSTGGLCMLKKKIDAPTIAPKNSHRLNMACALTNRAGQLKLSKNI